ncbi:MAG: hypothetical protein COB02_14910 [Candidatus Cloacimonadota bacterium]|nr:MAG: hypothetical protein COB02_14910 [Candidatus Cloacimonadota bacterium]
MSKRIVSKSKKTEKAPLAKANNSSPIHWKEILIGFILGAFTLIALILIRYQLTQISFEKIVLQVRNQSSFVFENKDKQPVIVNTPIKNLGDPKVKECSRLRWLIKSSVVSYNKKYKTMKQLKVFELMGKSYLKEMPNCPNNGKYQLVYKQKEVEISCSHHGITK